MFEKEIKFITDFNLNRIKRAGSLFTLDSLTSAGVHPSIVQYISAELEYLIYLDRQKLLQKSVFDYSGEETTKYFNFIAGEIKKKKLIPYEDVKKLVEQAVMFNVNFVLRPNWTFMKFIFNGDELKSTEEILLFMNYAYYYSYIKSIILNVIEKRKILALSSIEFNEFLEKIQKELVTNQIEKIYDDSLTSITDFINQGEVNKKKISIGTYEIFLKEKELHESIYKLRKILSVDPKQKFDIKDVTKALLTDIPIEFEENSEPEVQEVELETMGPQPIDEHVEEVTEEIPDTMEPAESKEELQTQVVEELVYNDNEEVTAEISEIEESIQFNLTEDEEESPADEISIDDFPIESEIEIQPEVFPEVEEEIELHVEPEELPILESVVEEEVVQENGEIQTEEDTTTEDLLSLYLSPEPEAELDEQAFEPEMEQESTEHESLPEEEDYLKILMEDKDPKEEEYKDFAEILEETANDISPEEEEENKNVTNDSMEVKEIEPAEEVITQPNMDTVEIPQGKTEQSDDDSPQIDLFDYFTAKESMKIVAVIFNQDSIDFVNTLERITECRNFDEANEVLKAVFFSYKINPFSTKEAILLKQRIENYFRDRFR